MIIQSLYKLAQREGLVDDLNFEPKQIAWLVRVSPEGKLIGIEGTHYISSEEAKKKKPKPMAKTYIVPRQPQRSGKKPKPGHLVDNALYVFGIDLKGSFKKDDICDRAKWFKEEVETWANETEDEALLAVDNFLNDVYQGNQRIDLPDNCKSNDLFKIGIIKLMSQYISWPFFIMYNIFSWVQIKIFTQYFSDFKYRCLTTRAAIYTLFNAVRAFSK